MASNDAESLGQGQCVRQTDRAILVALESGEEKWIPSSVVHDDSEVYDANDNATGEVVVQRWWAEKEGLA